MLTSKQSQNGNVMRKYKSNGLFYFGQCRTFTCSVHVRFYPKWTQDSVQITKSVHCKTKPWKSALGQPSSLVFSSGMRDFPVSKKAELVLASRLDEKKHADETRNLQKSLLLYARAQTPVCHLDIKLYCSSSGYRKPSVSHLSLMGDGFESQQGLFFCNMTRDPKKETAL